MRLTKSAEFNWSTFRENIDVSISTCNCAFTNLLQSLQIAKSKVTQIVVNSPQLGSKINLSLWSDHTPFICMWFLFEQTVNCGALALYGKRAVNSRNVGELILMKISL